MNDKEFSRVLISICLLVMSGCGGSSGGATMTDDGGANGNCAPYVVPTGTDLTTPTMSFSSDIMKLFNDSCDLSSCHGNTTNPQGALFLGLESAMRSDAAQVYSQLVGHDSMELTSMPFITASDPSASFLMHKLDGDQCQFNSRCVGGNCGDLMPSGDDVALPVATRDSVRRWIAQGALDN